MINTIIKINKLEEKKRGFIELIKKESLTKKIKKVSEEKANKLGEELYNLICKRGYNDNWEEALKLVIEGANINILMSNGKDTPLLKCCRTNYPKTVTMLIKAGVDVNLANNYGTTPSMSAARHNCIDILKMLVWMGADINKRCQDGDTALISAYRHNAKDCVTFLVNNQANLTCKNVDGESIFKYINDPAEALAHLEETKQKEYTHEEAMSIIEEAQKQLQKIKGND